MTKKLVDGLDYKQPKESNSVSLAQKKSIIGASSQQLVERAKEILELVHSDVCGKLEVKSLSGYQ